MGQVVNRKGRLRYVLPDASGSCSCDILRHMIRKMSAAESKFIQVGHHAATGGEHSSSSHWGFVRGRMLPQVNIIIVQVLEQLRKIFHASFFQKGFQVVSSSGGNVGAKRPSQDVPGDTTHYPSIAISRVYKINRIQSLLAMSIFRIHGCNSNTSRSVVSRPL